MQKYKVLVMNKKIILLTSLLGLLLLTGCDTLEPKPDSECINALEDGNTWEFEVYYNPDIEIYQVKQVIEGDTTFSDGMVFKRLCTYVDGEINDFIANGILRVKSVDYVFEEGGHIYYYSPATAYDTETYYTELYNLNMKKGDQLRRWIVEDVSTVTLNDGLERRYTTVRASVDKSIKDYWVEGIGSMEKGLNSPDYKIVYNLPNAGPNYRALAPLPTWKFLRFTSNGKVVYSVN